MLPLKNLACKGLIPQSCYNHLNFVQNTQKRQPMDHRYGMLFWSFGGKFDETTFAVCTIVYKWDRCLAPRQRVTSLPVTLLAKPLDLVLSVDWVQLTLYTDSILEWTKYIITHAPLFWGGEDYVCESPVGDSSFVMNIQNPYMHCVTSQYVFELLCEVIILLHAVTMVTT